MDNTVLNKGSTPFRTVMLLSWPAIVEQMLLSLASYVDTAMLGSIGATATAAVAVNASTTWLLGGLMAATGVGFTFLVARNIGAQKMEDAQLATKHAVVFAVLLGLFITLITQSIAAFLPTWLGAAEEVRPLATAYMRIIGAAMLFQTCNSVFSSLIRAAGNMRTPMRINLTANAINVVGNFFLIYDTRDMVLFGKTFTIPGAGLGVQGAALATAACYVSACLMLGAYLLKGKIPIKLNFREKFHFNRRMIRDALTVAIPAAMERIFMSFGQIAMTAMVTSIGTVQLAAHHLAITAESISYLPAYGISTCASTLIGQALGAKQEDKAEYFGKLIYRIGFVIMTFGGLLLFTCAEPLIRIFSSDPGVIEEGMKVLRIVAFVEPFYGLSIVISGALDGAGDARMVFLIDAFSMWGVRIGTAYLLSHTFGMGLQGAWLGMSADLFVRGMLFYIRFRRGKWKTVWNKRHK